MFNSNINNISVYMVEETGPDYLEKTTHPSKVTHNVVSSTLTMSGIRTHNVSGDSDRNWLHKKHVNLNSQIIHSNSIYNDYFLHSMH
jgi:hypothetical protein